MSYREPKPFGRRKTDVAQDSSELRHFQRIRRDVDEDATGLLRRYLRLSAKVLDQDVVEEQGSGVGEPATAGKAA